MVDEKSPGSSKILFSYFEVPLLPSILFHALVNGRHFLVVSSSPYVLLPASFSWQDIDGLLPARSLIHLGWIIIIVDIIQIVLVPRSKCLLRHGFNGRNWALVNY